MNNKFSPNSKAHIGFCEEMVEIELAINLVPGSLYRESVLRGLSQALGGLTQPLGQMKGMNA